MPTFIVEQAIIRSRGPRLALLRPFEDVAGVAAADEPVPPHAVLPRRAHPGVDVQHLSPGTTGQVGKSLCVMIRRAPAGRPASLVSAGEQDRTIERDAMGP